MKGNHKMTLSKKGTAWFADDGASHAIHGLIRPQAWHHEGRTYVVYMGKMNAPQITYYDHAQREWSQIVPAGVNPLGDKDTHGAPAMLIDREGFILLFFGSHGGAQKYVRSKRPGDITEWEPMPDITGNGTYPFPVLMADGTILLFMRKGMHDSPWFEICSRDGGLTWSAPKDILSFVPQGIYASFWPGSDGKTVHCTFAHDDLTHPPEWEHRRHCFYMRRDVDGRWKSVTGDALDLPVGIETAFGKCLVARTDPPTHGNVGCIGVDRNNRPTIVFLHGEVSKADFTLKCARWTGTGWAIGNITQTDDVFDHYCAIFPDDNDRIRAYLIAGGSDATEIKRGGDLQLWSSEDGGQTWNKEKDIITRAETSELYANPDAVVHGHPDGRIVFCSWHHGITRNIINGKVILKGYRSDDFTHRVFLFGDSGFLGRP